MKAKKDDVDWWDKPISTADAAAMLGISAARLRQLSASGLVEKTGHGMTTPALAARGACAFWENKASEKTKTASDSRVRDARAREIEMRNDERMRKLIPLDDALAIMDEYTAVVREAMDSIPARVTRDIGMRRVIEAEVNAAHETIAKAHGAGREDARTGKDRP
ncbi:hypothetical protein FY133_01030 [Agrobacterium tumefaciens]|uniref:type IV toxin-antitoxin system AbiEi family antitoxin domain-containing protein n=1 Tax=Agrobacterium tumefaciens TaxID=358 RepID=UPI0021CDF696|nr:type IV toxin-antitoxin system AbiEi family antitoxin domain-containing protein [Agrobacterium tumefaciens]UXS08195.1 hypothetical protein FY155_00725 [Agrobacterium tumefaciens]UXS15558.1 hypothetical protein FY154_00725 [Agrobacterium tumefaciens]UXT64227.1 hypothetical protein FY133_01030 [Agrobacterium tumefaciens]